MAKITVNAAKCTGCGQCVNVCPMGIYVIVKGKSSPDPKKFSTCMICHACEVSCPSKAITLSE